MASVIDQMLLSGLNFLIGLALIRLAAKETYGLYSQLFGLGILATTLLESLIGSALTTHAARVPDDERLALLARVFRLQMMAAGALAVVFAVGLMLSTYWVSFTEPKAPLALAFALVILSQGCREYCRTAMFIQSDALGVLRMDATFVMASIVLGAAYLWSGHVSVAGVLAVLALCNLVGAVPFGTRIASHQAGFLGGWRSDMPVLWSMGQWAIVGAVVAWLVNYSYLYFAGLFLGSAALADLNAARLLLIPIAVLSMAWTRVARPQMGRMIAQHEHGRVHRFLWLSSAVMVAFALAYTLALWGAFPWVRDYILGQKYANVSTLLLLWGVYFAINSARVAGTTLLTSHGVFKALFWQGLVSAVLLVALCAVLIPNLGVYGAIAAMMTVEVVELITNWLYMLPRARRGHFKTH